MKLNTLSLIAALSLLTCPETNCALFSKLGSFSTRFVPKATILASGYKFFKPTVGAEDKRLVEKEPVFWKEDGIPTDKIWYWRWVFRPEVKKAIVDALCTEGEFEILERGGSPDCNCVHALFQASYGIEDNDELLYENADQDRPIMSNLMAQLSDWAHYQNYPCRSPMYEGFYDFAQYVDHYRAKHGMLTSQEIPRWNDMTRKNAQIALEAIKKYKNGNK